MMKGIKILSTGGAQILIYKTQKILKFQTKYDKIKVLFL